jgi:hypothetical protein
MKRIERYLFFIITSHRSRDFLSLNKNFDRIPMADIPDLLIQFDPELNKFHDWNYKHCSYSIYIIIKIKNINNLIS